MKKTLLFILSLLFIISCGSSPESLRKEWYEYSRPKLKDKMSEIIGELGWYKNTVLDTDKGLQWSYYSGSYTTGGTFLQFLQNGYGRIIVQEVDAFGTIIGRDWVSGEWWIKQSPSANGVLVDEIVFMADNARDGLQMDPTNLPGNFAFIDLDDFFAHKDQVPWYSVLNYLEFADNLRFEFMKGKNIIFSKDEGFIDGDINTPFTLYWHDGKVRVKGEFSNGEKDGNWEWFWSNGNKTQEGDYSQGIMVGKWVNYMATSGDTLAIRNFDANEKLHGKYIVFDVKKTEGSYKEGKKDGMWTYKNKNGSFKTEYYNNGVNSGIWVNYDESGDTASFFNFNILKDYYGVWRSTNDDSITINRFGDIIFGERMKKWEPILTLSGNEVSLKDYDRDENQYSNPKLIFSKENGEKIIRVTSEQDGYYYLAENPLIGTGGPTKHKIYYSSDTGDYHFADKPREFYRVEDHLFGKWSDRLEPEMNYEFMSGHNPQVGRYMEYLDNSYYNDYCVMVTYNKKDKRKFKEEISIDVRRLPKKHIDRFVKKKKKYKKLLNKGLFEQEDIEAILGFHDGMVIDTMIFKIKLDGIGTYENPIKIKVPFNRSIGFGNETLAIELVTNDSIVFLSSPNNTPYTIYRNN